MSYIVWHELSVQEGWQPSEELDSLDQCFDHIHRYTYGGKYVITSPVAVRFQEAPAP